MYRTMFPGKAVAETAFFWGFAMARFGQREQSWLQAIRLRQEEPQ